MHHGSNSAAATLRLWDTSKHGRSPATPLAEGPRGHLDFKNVGSGWSRRRWSTGWRVNVAKGDGTKRARMEHFWTWLCNLWLKQWPSHVFSSPGWNFAIPLMLMYHNMYYALYTDNMCYLNVICTDIELIIANCPLFTFSQP